MIDSVLNESQDRMFFKQFSVVLCEFKDLHV